MGVFEELQARGLIAQITNEEEIKNLVKENSKAIEMMENKFIFYLKIKLFNIIQFFLNFQNNSKYHYNQP